MKVSLNTVKQYTSIHLSVDELVEKINEQLGSVEEVINLGKRYDGAIIAKIISCKKHENADKLSVCEIDAGTGETIQVVCGAPNVREGMYVVWLQPGATVPSSFSDKEPFVLEARELRGVVSNGMLASAKELGIGESHDGILEIDPTEWKPTDVEIKPGTDFAHAFGLDDYIIDIENKMFTHRPDLFGHIGVAREIAGILGQEFEEKEWYWNRTEFVDANELELEIFNETQENVPRFMAVAMSGVDVNPSPLWLQCALVAMGSKPINNVVDATNYIMLLTAQPTHAYDYDKLRGHKLGTRMARSGETATLLNGKTYSLTENDIVIVDGEGIVGLGGIMGGGNSEVTADTKNIVLEVANFDMYTVRKSSMRHGLFTDALTRFNKGQSPLQTDRILNLLMMSIKDISSNANQASPVYDIMADDLQIAHEAQSLNGTLKVEPHFINERLGLNLTTVEMEQLLRNVRFACYVDKEAGDTAISFTAPFWRTDIELPEDIVEEVGRLYGFDKLPRELPQRSMKPAIKNHSFARQQAIREAMLRSGANEVLTYSFIHKNIFEKAGQDPVHAYKLTNALSPDLQYYRLSLTPSLLDKVHMNSKAGYDQFVLYELNKVHYKGEMDETEPSVPNEDKHVALVIASDDKHKPAGSPYYTAQKYLSRIVHLKDVALMPMIDFDMTRDEWGAQLAAPYEPRRSAVIVKDEQVRGVIGEYKRKVKRSFKLPDFCAGFEIHQDLFSEPSSAYTPLSKYPSLTQDISLKVNADILYANVVGAAESVLSEYNKNKYRLDLTPLSIYQATNEPTHKTISLRLRIASYERTLKESDVSAIMEAIALRAKNSLGAERI